MPRDVEYAGLMTPEDMSKFLERVQAGDTLTKAAAAINWSLASVLNRINRDEKLSERYAQARTVGAVAKADQVDGRMEELVYADSPNAAIVNRWAGRHHPGYRERTEIIGAYTGPQHAGQRSMPVDMHEVAAILAEANVRMTLEPAEQAQEVVELGPAQDVSGPELLPARPDPETDSVPARKRRQRRKPAAD